MTVVRATGMPRAWRLGLWGSLLLAGACSGPSGDAAGVLSEEGIGPLRVGLSFERAERLAARLAPPALYSGPGCAGLQEIRYDIRLGNAPVGLMAMGEDGRISEVEATLLAPTRAASQRACAELRDDFAQPFVARFGPYARAWQIDKPVSTELLARAGPVVVAARWFETGQTCYVSARFGARPD